MFSYPVCMLAAKGHPLLPLVDTVVQRMRENGLLNKIDASFSRQWKRKDATNKPAERLCLKHTRPAFMLYILGNIIAMLVFFFETVALKFIFF